jgi:hypothetical protein
MTSPPYSTQPSTSQFDIASITIVRHVSMDTKIHQQEVIIKDKTLNMIRNKKATPFKN